MQQSSRNTGLRIVLLLLIASNSAGIFKLLRDPEGFAQVYTLFSPGSIRWLLIIPAATIIALIAIFFGKKWGFYTACTLYGVIMFLDIYHRVWAHTGVATIGFVLLAWFYLRSIPKTDAPSLHPHSE
jgi:hypothetical protein